MLTVSWVPQHALPEKQALQYEYTCGLTSLAEVGRVQHVNLLGHPAEPATVVRRCHSQAAAGAARFASGEGRHGSFGGGTEEGRAAVQAVLFDLGGVIVNSPFVQVILICTSTTMQPCSLMRCRNR